MYTSFGIHPTYPKIQQQKEAPPPKKIKKNMSFFMSFLGLGIFQENLEFTFIINLEFSKKWSPSCPLSCPPDGVIF